MHRYPDRAQSAAEIERSGWQRTAPCPLRLYDAGGARVGRNLYVVLGYQQLNAVNEQIFVFDLEQGQMGRRDQAWAQDRSFPYGRVFGWQPVHLHCIRPIWAAVPPRDSGLRELRHAQRGVASASCSAAAALCGRNAPAVRAVALCRRRTPGPVYALIRPLEHRDPERCRGGRSLARGTCGSAARHAPRQRLLRRIPAIFSAASKVISGPYPLTPTIAARDRRRKTTSLHASGSIRAGRNGPGSQTCPYPPLTRTSRLWWTGRKSI